MKITTSHIVKEFIEKKYHSNKFITDKNIDAVSTILENVILNSYAHGNVKKLDVFEFLEFMNSNYISVKYLKSNVGRNYKKIVDTFFKYTKYNKIQKITRAYKLKDDILIQILEFIRDTKDTSAKWMSENNRVINTVKYGIVLTDDNNKRIKSTIQIDTLVRINVDALDECINAIIKILLSGKFTSSERIFLQEKGIGVGILDRGGKELLLKNLWKLYALKRLSIKKNAFPQYYIESGNGRITGVGFNLQNTIGKEIRKIALSNQNMYDYDMEASTPTILVSLGNKYNVKVSAMESYLHNKDKVRKELSDNYDISIKDIKSAMISLFYGVGTSLTGLWKYQSGLIKVFKSKSSTKEFLNDVFIKNIISEREILFEKIIENAEVSRGKALYNVLRKSCSLLDDKYGKIKDRDINSLVSHIVFGYEALIIQTTFEILKKKNIKTYLLVNDGFVADEIRNLRNIEQQVIKKLKDELPNLQLKFSMDKL